MSPDPSSAASTYAFLYWRQIQPDAKAKEEQAKSVSAACRMALDAVGINQHRMSPRPIEVESLFPVMGRRGLFGAAASDGVESGEEAVMKALGAIGDLKRWADSFAEVARKEEAMQAALPEKKGRPENHALGVLLGALSDIYFSAWDNLPSLKSFRRTGSADGW